MPEDLSSYVEERLTVSAKRINRCCQLKPKFDVVDASSAHSEQFNGFCRGELGSN